jgi:hypothetical protein
MSGGHIPPSVATESRPTEEKKKKAREIKKK